MADAVLQPDGMRHQLAQPLRQLRDDSASAGAEHRLGDLDLVVLGAGLLGGHLALGHGALHQQPGGDLHQPRRQPHALGGVGQRDLARQRRRIRRGRRRRDRLAVSSTSPMPSRNSSMKASDLTKPRAKEIAPSSVCGSSICSVVHRGVSLSAQPRARLGRVTDHAADVARIAPMHGAAPVRCR